MPDEHLLDWLGGLRIFLGLPCFVWCLIDPHRITILNFAHECRLGRLLPRDRVVVAPPPVLRGSRDFVQARTARGLGDGLLAKGYPVAALLRGHQQGQDLLGLSSTDFKLLTEGPISPGRSSLLLMRGPRGGH